MAAGENGVNGDASCANTFMMSLQCPSCDWIWSDSFTCRVENLTPRCPKCSHEPVLALKIYGV
jgi:ssDNA-binding Zn-finger/Zn-ribbon topoisomerase 1